MTSETISRTSEALEHDRGRTLIYRCWTKNIIKKLIYYYYDYSIEKEEVAAGAMRAQVALLIQSTRIWSNNLVDADFGESLCTRHFHVATGLLLLFFSLDVPVVYMLPLLCVLCPFYVTTV